MSNIQNKIKTLEDLISIQEDSLIDGYMYGMINGMILSHSVLTDSDPCFRSQPKEKNKIRHKIRRKN